MLDISSALSDFKVSVGAFIRWILILGFSISELSRVYKTLPPVSM